MKTLYWIAGVLVAALLLRMYFNGVDRSTLQDVPKGTPHLSGEELKTTGAGNAEWIWIKS
jgi:hypothetical protein